MLTDQGLCYSLNGKAIGDLFQSSEYLDSLAANMIWDDFQGNESAPEKEGGMIRTKGSGPLHKIRIALDAQGLAMSPE